MEHQKLFVVIAVLAFILVGLISYLIVVDRKVSKLEKEIKEHTNSKKV